MLPENAARIFSRGAGFGAEAGGPGGDADREFFFRDGLVAIEVVELDFGSGRKPKVSAFQLEKFRGEFWQLARARERRAVDDKGRQNLRVSVFAGMDVKEEIGEGPFEARTPAFVNSEASAGDFRGCGKIENARTFAHFPVWLRLETKFRRCAPTPNLDILRRAVPNRYAGVWQIRNPEQKVFLLLCQFDGSEALDLDWLREGLHLSDERIRIQVFFLEPPNLVAGFVPLRPERLRLRDQRAPLAVQRAEAIQFECDATLLRHFGEDIQVIADVI